MHKIEPGQVLFSPFAVLGPGEFVLLKVHARAEAAGTHTFRAEVHCLPLETRLVCEDTTRFYQEDSAPWQLSDRAEPREAPMGVPAAAPLQAEAGLMPITAERPTPAAVR
jgi:hypothetical protein